MTEADSPTIVSMQVAILRPCACSTGWNSPAAACAPCGCGAGGSAVVLGAGAADGFPFASLFPAAAPAFAAGTAACSFCARSGKEARRSTAAQTAHRPAVFHSIIAFGSARCSRGCLPRDGDADAAADVAMIDADPKRTVQGRVVGETEGEAAGQGGLAAIDAEIGRNGI